MSKETKALFVLEDNSLFSDMFVSATEMLDDIVNIELHKFSDKAEEKYKELLESKKRPDVLFVDINLVGSSFDGLEFVRKINFEYGNEVVIGIISTSEDEVEMAKAVKNGAQFWIKKTGDLDEILPAFFKDLKGYKSRTQKFKVYE